MVGWKVEQWAEWTVAVWVGRWVAQMAVYSVDELVDCWVDYSAAGLDAQWELLLVGWKVEQWAE